MTKPDPPRIGGLQLDPAVLDALNKGAARNQAALTGQQRREQRRICLRLDCPAWLKTEAARIAAAEETTISHLADFLLAWAMAQYRAGNADLRAAIEDNKFAVRSLQARFGLAADQFKPLDDDETDLYKNLFTSASADA